MSTINSWKKLFLDGSERMTVIISPLFQTGPILKLGF